MNWVGCGENFRSWHVSPCPPTGPIWSPQLPSCAAWASSVSCLMTGARTLPKPSPFSSKKECEDSMLHLVLKNEQQRKTFNQFDEFFLKSVWPLHIIFDKLYSCKILHNHRLTLFCNTWSFYLQIHQAQHQKSPVAQWLQICLQCRSWRRDEFKSLVGNIPWRRKWQPTPVFLPGESHGKRTPARLQSMGPKRGRHDWAHMYH